MAHKYEMNFTDTVVGDTYQLRIFRNGYSYAPTVITGSGNPIKISWKNTSDLFEPIIVSEATVEVVSESDLFYKDFFTAQSGDWKLQVLKNSSVIWSGQNLTENYSEPYTVVPYTSNIKFSDFGDLDFLYYKNGASFYSGYRSLSQIILDCTNKLSFNLELTDTVDAVLNVVWASQFPLGTRSFLMTTTMDARAFITYKDNQAEAYTCMEVLRRIMRAIGCRMFQWENRIYILSLNETANTAGDITTAYDITTANVLVPVSPSPTAGVYTLNILKTVDNTPITGICPVGQNQDLTVTERYTDINHTFVTQEALRKNDELIFNSKFDKGIKTYNGTSKFPDHYEVSSDIAASLACEIFTNGNKKYLAMINEVNTPLPMTGMINAQGKLFTIASNQAKYYLKPTGSIQDQVTDQIQLTTDDNLRVNVSGELTKVIDYVYLFSQSSPPQNATNAIFEFGFYIKLNYDSGQVYYLTNNSNAYQSLFLNKPTMWTVTPSLFVYNVKTPSYNPAGGNIPETHVDNIDIGFDTAMFPINGLCDVEIRFYLPRYNGTTLQPAKLESVSLDEFSIKYVSDNDFSDDIVTNFAAFTITGAKKNVLEYKVFIGDGPTDYVLNTFRHPDLNSYGYPLFTYRYSTVQPVNFPNISGWRKQTAAGILAAKEIFNINPMNKFLTSYQRKIKGDYMGNFGILHALEIDDGTAVKRYVLLGDTWDVKSGIHSIDMQEVSSDVKLVVTTSHLGPKKKKKKKNFNASPYSISTSFTTLSNNLVVNNPVSKPKFLNNNIYYPG